MAQDITIWGASYSDVPAVTLPKTGGGTAKFYDDTGTKNITTSGTHDVTGFQYAEVDVDPSDVVISGAVTSTDDGEANVAIIPTGGGEPHLQTKSVTYTPSTSQQTDTVAPDSGYDGLEEVDVTINPIPSQYIIPSGTKSITQNGTGIDVASYANVDVNVPTGATNLVHGEFTAQSSTGVQSVTIPYTGNGYPLMAYISVKGGAYNNTSTGQTDWYNSMQRYAIGVWTMSKSIMDTTPTYGTSGSQNQAVTMSIYKNSTSSSTSYTRTSAMNTNTYSSSNASNAAATAVRFKSKTSMSVYVNTSSYGLLPGITYEYWIVYSS